MSMSRNTQETLFTIAYILMAVVGTTAAGLLTFGVKFFAFPRPIVPFYVIGLAGALIYASVQLRGFGFVFLVLVLFYLGELAMLGSLRGPALVPKLTSAAIFTLPIGVMLVIASYICRSLQRLRFGKFIIIAALVAIGYGVMLILWLGRSHVGLQTSALLYQSLVGLKVGAGIGLGVELVDFFGGPRPSRAYDLPGNS